MALSPVAPGEKQTVTLVLEDTAFLGEALARFEGQPVFVANGIAGEEVVVSFRRRGRRYIEADIEEITKPSPHRVKPPCPYFGPCTGCQWQHIEYSHQLEMKLHVVKEQLKRVAGFDDAPVRPVIPSDSPWNYRNHARFTIGPNGQLGYVNRRTRRFVRIDSCMIMHQGINDILSKLQDKCGETTQLSVRYGVNTGQFMIQPTLQSQDIPVPSGQKYYEEEMFGRGFCVASPSFFQVNIPQAEKLIGIIEEGLRLAPGDLLLDAYAGVGTFAVLLAPKVKKVFAIEESPSAVHDAISNAEGLDNIEFLEGKTELLMPDLPQRPEKVVLDPPRAGCQPVALAALAKLAPSRVAYVSCDPETLARDLKIMCNSGYKLEYVQPIDMFPHTHHIESVAVLEHQT